MHHSAQLVSLSPSLMKGLSKLATTFSHSGQLPTSMSSSSLRIFSIFFSESCVFFRPFPPPMPGIQPTGAVTTLASVSGMIRSRNLSPADSRLRPRDLAVPYPFCVGALKFAESRVRPAVG